MKQNKAKSRRQREEHALNRVLLWFGGAVALEVMIVLFNRFYIRYGAGATRGTVLLGRAILGLGILAVLCAVFFGVRVLAGRRAGAVRTFHGAGLVLSAAVALICFVTIWWRGVGVQVLYGTVPIVAVLALVYYLYQREFFAICVVGGGTLLISWMAWQAGNRPGAVLYAACMALGVCVLAVAALAHILQRGDGVLAVGGKKWRILPKRATYPMVYAACAVAAAVIPVCLLLGATAAYYTIFVCVAWVFVAAIYYTVRLM